MEKYGLVLEGGGAKGAYHVGAYLALLEMGFSFEAIVGTSIGALNAAMFVSGQSYQCLKAWKSLSLDFFNKNIEISNKSYENLDLISLIKAKLNEITKKVSDIGISPQPLFDLVDKLIDEEKIRKSQTDFGLCTVNISDFKSEELFTEDMAKGQIKNYIIASCYLPIFKPQALNGKYYLDGGFHSQAPINMVLRKNLSPIVIRLKNLPSLDNLDAAKYIIGPKHNLGKLMDFDPDKSDNLIRLGYFDAYKEIKNLKGYDYYIKEVPEEDSLKYIYKLLRNSYKENENLFMRFVVENLIPKFAKEFKLKKDYDYRDILYMLVEKEAKKKHIDRLKIYNIDELIGEIIDR